MRISSKTKKLIVLIVVLVLLCGCQRIVGEDGKILPEKVISLSTPFKDLFSNEGWFEALIVWPLAQLINWIDKYISNIGITVILVTILSRLITLRSTIKSSVASQKMQMIQPEMARIQEKYAGKTDEQSRLKMSQEQMALYQKHGINPMSSIGLTFLQFPIMIGIWQAVQRAEAVATGTFLGLDMQLSPLNEIKTDFMGNGWKYLILLIILAAVQYLSMKLPTWLARKNMNDRQKKMAKAGDQSAMMMNVMFVMIVFMALSMPTAMSFYWVVSAGIQAIQTVYIQKRYIDHE